jgi:trimethylamine:corrinoid methyltransferase-like protein
MALRLVKGIELREGMSNDLYGDIYDGDHFLTSEHTIRWLREEFYFPSEVFDRANYQTWLATDGRSIGERARRKVQQILQQEPPQPLDKSVLSQLEQIMIGDAKKYGMEKLP